MKKVLRTIMILALALCMCLAMTACSTVNEDGTLTPAGVAIEQGITVLARALEAALAIAGTWVLSKIGKRKELQNTNIALEILFDITRQTVGELQQLYVKGWKEAGGGKLTDGQAQMLRQMLLDLVKEKLDQPTQDLLTAAGADINALISGAAEDWINTIKMPSDLVYVHDGYTDHVSDEPAFMTGPGVEDSE